MQLQQNLTQEQKLSLTQAVRQSLQCLQMSAMELSDYLQEAALSNPLLEVEDTPQGQVDLEAAERGGDAELIAERQGEWSIWDRSPVEGKDFTAYISHAISYTEYLDSQLNVMPNLDPSMLALCHYLVGCLNSAGYLDCPLSELAEELKRPLFDLEQALFAVQTLDPPGTGARSLSECLLLQLAEGEKFTETNIHLVQEGLPLLAAGDYAGLAALLKVSQRAAQQAAHVIQALNPIPSRGFYADSKTPYILPEAMVTCGHGQITIEMNARAIPRVSLREDYCALLGKPECAEAQPYLKEKIADAKSVLANVQNRQVTLSRLISAAVQRQIGYFLEDGELIPLTMQQIADELSLSVSTVSRAARDKYIQFNGRMLALRSLFTAAVQTTEGTSVSPDAAKRHIRRFIQSENPRSPLSDEALTGALLGVGIVLSRRTVAKYRSELGIASAAARKKNAAGR
ncbi:RNA polymerase, sigma 54 subunit, RpoN/SigL [Oscillibacter sp. PC13]|uniref:RNA polymerase factor sigma-54 n=1 Tax=Oscillibacter sp. PC13 TaxID=1855299 RepID=UPI0008F40484|nr:RNA polymerase factor sigma-54 [Oscillibacter sp. PC13]SFO96058.1 RNA polymerase, sigma 54 subunit, RpoN/SigL [Oscillibacter sp. PC13]